MIVAGSTSGFSKNPLNFPKIFCFVLNVDLLITLFTYVSYGCYQLDHSFDRGWDCPYTLGGS